MVLVIVSSRLVVVVFVMLLWLRIRTAEAAFMLGSVGS